VQKQHSTVQSDEVRPNSKRRGAEGHGTVVFDVVTTVPCSGSKALRKTESQDGTVECRNNRQF